MNYELAKKLKDAGFHQPEFDVNSNDINRDDFLVPGIDEDKEGMLPKYFSREFLSGAQSQGRLVYSPSLEELIEACGHISLDNITQDGRWRAKEENGIPQYGSTPDVAVANLWLKLNEKK